MIQIVHLKIKGAKVVRTIATMSAIRNVLHATIQAQALLFVLNVSQGSY